MATEIRQIQVRRDTAANWTSANPTLAAGEIGYETDTGKFKVGNGSSAWTAITVYFVADADLMAIAALSPSNDDILQRKSSAWTNRTVAQFKSDLALNNVDNTSDSTKNAAAVTLTNKTLTSPIINTATKELITSLTSDSSPSNDDELIIWSEGDDDLRRMSRGDFLTGVGGGLSGLGATDNAVPRTSGTGGGTLEGTGVLINDSNEISAAKFMGLSGLNAIVQPGGAGNEARLNDGDGNTPVAVVTKQVKVYGLSEIPQDLSITSNQDNYTVYINLGCWLRVTTDASRDITGIVVASPGNVAGLKLLITNVGSNNLVLKHNVTSTAGNRFLFSTGADITLAPNKSCQIIFDGTTARWRDL